ncbi:MAG: cupin domain-containing protein [Actinobacteria bacterium]|nr:MAG: cupin domain-containing protein [Actinomycetota bacterium]
MSQLSDSPPPVALERSVGARLRSLRTARRLTLREIAERASLSESFVSQLERGQSGATIQSLQRISAALGVDVSDLFAEDTPPGPRIMRRETRHPVAWGTLGRKALLTPKPFEALEVVAAEFEPGGSTGDVPYTHGDSEELFLVIEGSIDLELGGETFTLGVGDSAHYRSSTPHRAFNPGPHRAEVIYVISPPSY